MQQWFLLLTLCALAVAVPLNNEPVNFDAQLGTRSESKVIQIANSAGFSAGLSEVGDELVVVFSMANWCPFSRNIIPTVEDIAATNEDVVVIFQVDVSTVETTPGVPWEYSVTSVSAIPTFFFIRSGILLERYTSGDSELLRDTVARYLASGRDYTLIQN